VLDDRLYRRGHERLRHIALRGDGRIDPGGQKKHHLEGIVAKRSAALIAPANAPPTGSNGGRIE